MKGELEISPEGEEYLEMLKGIGPSDKQKSDPKVYEQYKLGLLASELTSEKQNQDEFVLTYFKEHGPANPEVFKEFGYPQEILDHIKASVRRLYEGTQKNGNVRIAYLEDADCGVEI
tara:strand:- start:490 stop:840 length:351 start_codon:yes stop_codon:yes gene_type:complete